MTAYSMIVLALFVIMWAICSFELKMKNSLIRKLKKEVDDYGVDYNQLVSDYNDVIDFLEKHFTQEELRELFLEHDMDNFIGKQESEGMNEKVKEKIKRHLRENLEKR